MSTDRSTSLRDFRRDASAISFGTDDGEQRVDPSAVVSKFEAVESGSDRFEDELPPLELPGHDERRENCGEAFPRFCADCGSTCECGETCYQSGCPRCWKAWARRRAKTMSAKLEALRRYKEASGGSGYQGWKFHHLALSPPEGFAVDSDDPLQRTMDLLKEVLDSMGAATGVLFYHPYRGADGDDRGFWKDVLPDGEETSMAETREQLSDEPHFHAVVLAKYVATEGVTERVEHETGWVIHRITKGEDSSVSIYDKYDLARVTSYCISHTGIDVDGENRRVATRYYGEVANFAAEEKIEREMDAAVRSVATRTLGLNYDSLTCVVDRETTVESTEERWVEKINPDGAGMGDGPPEAELVEVTVEEDEERPCQGRLLDITKAPRFLEDDDWMADAENADELREAWSEWRERIDGDPPD